MEQRKLIPEAEVKTLLILKMFMHGLMSEAQVMDAIEFPKARGRQKRKYLLTMIEKLKKYDDMWPGHLDEMIKTTEEGLREHT
jgi:hypothetical protein